MVLEDENMDGYHCLALCAKCDQGFIRGLTSSLLEMAVVCVCVCRAAVENAGHVSFSEEEGVFNNSAAVIQSRRQPFYPQFIHERDCLFP